MSEQKNCLNCGQLIIGRIDKKFCDDQCRSNYNNRLNSNLTVKVRSINNILKRNRRMLELIAGNEGQGRISRQKLQEKGFNFKYFTHTLTTHKGAVYKLCYDFGYMPVENDFLLVVKWESEPGQ